MEQLPFSSRRNIFPLSFFPQIPLLPSLPPLVFFFPSVAWLGIWNRFWISDTSWKCSLANRNRAGLQKGPAQGLLWKHLGVSYASKNQSCFCRNNSRPLPSPSPCPPFKNWKRNWNAGTVFVKKQVVGRRCGRGWRTSPHQRTKILCREGFDCSTYICNSFSQAQDKLRIFQQLGEKSFKVQSAVLKRICAGLWGRLILLPVLGSSLQCAFSKAKILACFSVTPYKITNTQSKENNF